MANEFDASLLESIEDESAEALPAAPTYDDTLKQMNQMQSQQVKETFHAVKDIEPDRAAKVQQLADEMKIPRGVVERDYETFAKRKELEATDYTRLVQDNPALAEWIADPANAAVAKDDIDSLKNLEAHVQERGVWHELKNTMGVGFAQFNKGLAQTPGLIYDVAAAPANAYLKATGQKQISSNDVGLFEPARFAAQKYDQEIESYKSQAPALDMSIAREIEKGNYKAAGKALAFQVAAQSPNTIMMLAMGPTGGLAVAGATTAANKNAELQAQGVEPLKSVGVSAVAGGIEVAAERLGTFAVIDNIGKVVAKQYGKQVAKEVVKEFGITVAKGMGQEGAEEALTTLGQQGTDYLTGVNPDAMDDIGYQMFDSFAIGAGSSSATTAPMATAQAMRSKQMHSQAISDRNFYMAINETLEGSKLRERLPEAQRAYVERLTKDSPVEHIYVATEEAEAYFQSKGMPAAQMMQSLGVLKEYNEAKELGADIKIPLAVWATQVVGTEHYQALQNDIKFDPSSLTVNEANKLQEELAAASTAAVETTEDTSVRDAQAIIEQLKPSLEAAGYDPSQIDAYSKLFAERYQARARARGMGESSLELFNKNELEINSGELVDTSEQSAAQGGMLGKATELFQKLTGKRKKSTAQVFDQFDLPDSVMVGPQHRPLDENGGVGEAVEFNYRLNNASDVSYFVQDNKVVGHLGIDDDGKVQTVYVDKDYRRQGVAEKLYLQYANKHGELNSGDLMAMEPETKALWKKLEGRYPDRVTKTGEGYTLEGDGKTELFQSKNKINPLIRAEINEPRTALEDMQTSIPVPQEISITRVEEDAPSVAVAREIVKRTMRDAEVVNKQTGWNIEFPMSGLKKSFLTLGSEGNRLSILNIDKLMENALYWGAEANRRGDDKQVQAVHKFYAPLSAGNKNFVVRIDVREIGGKKYYNRFALEVPTASSDMAAGDLSSGQNGLRGSEQSLEVPSAESLSIGISPFIEQIKALKREDPFFQGETVKRGRIRFGNDRKFAIDLFQDKDLSTLLHESGHMWLEELIEDATTPGVSPQLQQDLDTALEWMGLSVRHSDGFDVVKGAVKTEQHEMWARGTEAYFMSGKAPSSALRKIFAKFKVWLTQIYKNVANLDVNITPEIQSVMNRMLATDEAIDQAYEAPELKGLFVDPRAMGMNEAMSYKYIQALDDARESARAEVTAKLMADHEKQFNAEAKAAKDKIREQITAEINAQPIYNALSLLQRGRYANGNEPPQGTTLKIDRAMLIAEYGAEILTQLPKGLTAKEGGLHISMVADQLGFKGADDLLGQLRDVQPKSELIEALTQQEFEAANPNMLTSGAIPQETIDAVHNEKRSQILRMELEHLASNNMPVLKEAIRRVARRVPTEAQIREQAAAIIAQKSMKDLKPYLFMRAEVKAAGEAGKLLAKGDVNGAFEAKRRELLNHELYRATLEARDQIEKAEKLFKKFRKTDEKLSKSRDADLVNAGRAVLALHGVGKRDKTPQSYIENIKKYDPEAYAGIFALIESVTQNSGPVSEMKFDDFVTLFDTLKAIWDLAGSSREMMIDGKVKALDEIKEELAAEIAEVNTSAEMPGFKKQATQWEQAKINLMSWRSALRRIEHWAQAMGRGRRDGAFTRYFVEPVMKATTDYRVEKKARLQQLMTILDPIKDGVGKRREIPAQNLGYTFSSKAELLGAILHTGNNSNLEKLLLGRGWGKKNDDGTLDRSQWDRFIEKQFNDRVITKDDMDTVQAIWDLLEEIKPAAQRAHKKMFGYYFNEITANEVVTPIGTYRGGYVPAMADTFLVEDAAARAEKDSLEQGGNSFMFPTTGRGFTKSREENYTVPLVMDLGLVPMHIDKVLRFVHVEPVVKDIGRIMFDKDFRKQLQAMDPTIASDMIIPWLQRTAQQRVMIASDTKGGKAADHLLGKLRTNASLQMMALNFTNAIQNFTGLFPAATKVKPEKLLKGFWEYTRSPMKTSEMVAEKSAFMSTRLGSQAMDIQNDIEKILIDPSAFQVGKQWMVHHAQIFQRTTQNIMEVSTWVASYDQAVGKGLTELDAVKFADQTVRETQGSLNPEDISAFETGTALKRALTMFFSYFNNQANLLGTQFQIHKDLGLGKQAAHAFHAYLLIVAAPAIVGAVIARGLGNGFDDDDDGEYIDDLMDVMVLSQLRYLTAMLPGGTVLNSAINAFNDKPFDDRITLSPVISVTERAIKAPFTVAKSMQGKGKASAGAKDALTAIGFITGTPGGAVARPVGYLMDVSQGEVKPQGAVDFSRGLITGKPGAGNN